VKKDTSPRAGQSIREHLGFGLAATFAFLVIIGRSFGGGGKIEPHRYRPHKVSPLYRNFVLHCHILNHEDRGMMQNIRIVLPNGQGRQQPFGHDHNPIKVR
jgi:Multicopper oxidase